MNNLVKFFNENPNELLNLIPTGRREDFFEKVKKIAIVNSEKDGEPTLTQKQFLQICLEINNHPELFILEKKNPIWKTKFGDLCLN